MWYHSHVTLLSIRHIEGCLPLRLPELRGSFRNGLTACLLVAWFNAAHVPANNNSRERRLFGSLAETNQQLSADEVRHESISVVPLTICCATEEYLSVDAAVETEVSERPLSFASFFDLSFALWLSRTPDRSLDEEEALPDTCKWNSCINSPIREGCLQNLD